MKKTLKDIAMKVKNRLNNSRVQVMDTRVLKEKIEFEKKVRKMLEKNENIINPYKILMDEEVMINLDERGKEIYLLNTMERYLEIRNKILTENLY